jgi:hypothetical protein
MLTLIHSPYTTEPVTLRIGPGPKEYYVSLGLLQNAEWIDSASWGVINLPEIDENTGHVLIHFLCTGTYQTLDNIENSAVEEAHVEFKRAFSAYVMAIEHQLAGLQHLAMHKIENFGRDMTVLDIIAAVEEDFHKLTDCAIGFKEYLNTKVKEALEKNHTVFLDDGTFDRINQVALSSDQCPCLLQSTVLQMM